MILSTEELRCKVEGMVEERCFHNSWFSICPLNDVANGVEFKHSKELRLFHGVMFSMLDEDTIDTLRHLVRLAVVDIQNPSKSITEKLLSILTIKLHFKV